MKLCERDRELLDTLRPHQFLTTGKLRALMGDRGGCGRRMAKRLKKLAAAGLVTRRVRMVATPEIAGRLVTWTLTVDGLCALTEVAR